MMTEDIFEVDLQKIRDSDFPEIIKAEVQDFIIWNLMRPCLNLALYSTFWKGVSLSE